MIRRLFPLLLLLLLSSAPFLLAAQSVPRSARNGTRGGGTSPSAMSHGFTE